MYRANLTLEIADLALLDAMRAYQICDECLKIRCNGGFYFEFELENAQKILPICHFTKTTFEKSLSRLVENDVLAKTTIKGKEYYQFSNNFDKLI